MSFYEGTLAPPGEHDWICASFSPLESTTQTANRSVKPFLPSWCQKVPIINNGRHYPPELPLRMVDLDPHVTHDAFLVPCEPTTQTARRSVQPCLYRWPRSVPMLYNGLSVSPSILHLPMLASGPHVIRGSLDTPESGTKWQLDRFSRFAGLCHTKKTDRATDRPTDHATRCDAA